MADTYVDVGDMGTVTDTKKVALKYQSVAKKVLKAAAVSTFKTASGYTPEKGDATEGYFFNAKLIEVSIGPYKGEESATVRLSGEVGTWPMVKMLTTSLTGNGIVPGGTKDRDVEFGMQSAMKKMILERVIPFLKTKPKA